MNNEETERGWDIFDAGGIWEIQRIDEAGKYADDEEAVLACCEAARRGNEYAIEALIAVAFQDSAGWPAYLERRSVRSNP